MVFNKNNNKQKFKDRNLENNKVIASLDEISSLNSFQGIMKYNDFNDVDEINEEVNDTGKVFIF